MSSNDKNEYLVEVNDLKQYFPIKTGFGKTIPLKAVDGVSFAIKPGETLGLVGESGCGKTTVGRSLLQLYKPTGGDVIFKGEKVTDKNTAQGDADGIPGSVFFLKSAYDRRRYHRRATGCTQALQLQSGAQGQDPRTDGSRRFKCRACDTLRA